MSYLFSVPKISTLDKMIKQQKREGDFVFPSLFL